MSEPRYRIEYVSGHIGIPQAWPDLLRGLRTLRAMGRLKRVARVLPASDTETACAVMDK